MKQVILNGKSIGMITDANLTAFLANSRMLVVSHTTTTICLEE